VVYRCNEAIGRSGKSLHRMAEDAASPQVVVRYATELWLSVVRFRNDDVMGNLSKVVQKISELLPKQMFDIE